MFFRFLQFIFLLSLISYASVCVSAQLDASTPSGRPRQEEDLPKSIKENLAKGRIEQEKKEYEELLKRGEEALKLAEDLETSFAANNQLSSEDFKKLERLEKIVKKIRNVVPVKQTLLSRKRCRFSHWGNYESSLPVFGPK